MRHLQMSIPSASVEDRIAQIQSKVRPDLLSGRTDVEKMLLNQSDISLQQNEILARAADEINQTLEEVKTQTTKTNGTVQNHEQRIMINEGVLKGYQDAAAKRTKMLLLLLPILVPLGQKVMTWVAQFLGIS